MRPILSLGIFLLGVTVMAQPVLAQSEDTGTRNSHTTRTTETTSTTVIFSPFLLLLPLSPYTSSTTTVGITTSGLVGMTVSTVRLLLPRGKACPQAVAYLRTNHRALEEEILLGGGGSIDELAFLMEIAEADRDEFARALRTHRDELLPHLHPQLDEEDATAFLKGVMALWG